MTQPAAQRLTSDPGLARPLHCLLVSAAMGAAANEERTMKTTWTQRATQAAMRKLGDMNRLSKAEFARLQDVIEFLNARQDRIDAAATPSWSDLCEARVDAWIPANGGTEVPMTTRTGRRVLYVFNPKSGDHAYLDLATDMILTYDEVALVLGL